MRIKKDGHRYTQDLSIQHQQVVPLRPRRLIAGNLKSCMAMLDSNLTHYGAKLTAEERQALELIVFNMKCLIGRMKE